MEKQNSDTSELLELLNVAKLSVGRLRQLWSILPPPPRPAENCDEATLLRLKAQEEADREMTRTLLGHDGRRGPAADRQHPSWRPAAPSHTFGYFSKPAEQGSPWAPAADLPEGSSGSSRGVGVIGCADLISSGQALWRDSSVFGGEDRFDRRRLRDPAWDEQQQQWPQSDWLPLHHRQLKLQQQRQELEQQQQQQMRQQQQNSRNSVQPRQQQQQARPQQEGYAPQASVAEASNGQGRYSPYNSFGSDDSINAALIAGCATTQMNLPPSRVQRMDLRAAISRFPHPEETAPQEPAPPSNSEEGPTKG
eukprot:gnl/TRDRNA2_/TRDRNA2_130866_c0_seq1.p1 gnl/TRDRNA2_/TRDRNA2_130866_c0~~gnl/TRDRNA2_/TRDRNA2_130866_c0_seq1.p1  ORF type:complete len:308 (+),score=62.82 gnl/TRDRNA2_/TRDRNA2_130866_c0_seq1:48-971(+)